MEGVMSITRDDNELEKVQHLARYLSQGAWYLLDRPQYKSMGFYKDEDTSWLSGNMKVLGPVLTRPTLSLLQGFICMKLPPFINLKRWQLHTQGHSYQRLPSLSQILVGMHRSMGAMHAVGCHTYLHLPVIQEERLISFVWPSCENCHLLQSAGREKDRERNVEVRVWDEPVWVKWKKVSRKLSDRYTLGRSQVPLSDDIWQTGLSPSLTSPRWQISHWSMMSQCKYVPPFSTGAHYTPDSYNLNRRHFFQACLILPGKFGPTFEMCPSFMPLTLCQLPMLQGQPALV